MVEKLVIDKQTRIGVLYGGLSSEREVSLRSGGNCHAALLRLGYENAVLLDVDTNVATSLKEKNIEIAFLCLHGKYGEDGTVQGLLELLRIPYTGSGVLASALAMDKILTKRVLSAEGLPYPVTRIISQYDLKSGDWLEELKRTLPVMIKPLKEGSSVGVTKADTVEQLEQRVKDTVTEYGGAIVESYISGQEITVGVLEDNKTANGNGSHLKALPILELRPKSKAGFYDYEAKYTKGMTEFILPAELSTDTTELAKDLAVKTFRALSCSGYARVDMMVDKNGKPYILELNSLPGMTDTSDLPAMADEAGITYDQLVELILMSAGLDK
ncbi:MAG: D-alanine--D-alanine ligase [Candidatus Obscuribacterales bacterium]|nr:D-alanine--D-alanine ligase [Candidatus Obscuribacterales bacterium]